MRYLVSLSFLALAGACGGGGAGGGVVAGTFGRFAFVTNSEEDTVSVYVLDHETGRLTYRDSAPTGDTPFAVAADPSGRNLYVANRFSEDLSQFEIGDDGSLTPLSPATVPGGDGPFAIVVSPSGGHVYMANAVAGTVSQYRREADGTLTPLDPESVPTGSLPYHVAVAPGGGFAYAVSRGDGNVAQYRIEPDGSLAPLDPPTVPAGAAAFQIAFTEDGDYAYVANRDSRSVSQYAVAADGTLAPLAPATVPAGSGRPVSIVARGGFVYTANSSSDDVSQFRIQADGTLVPLPTPTIAAGDAPNGITIDPSGKSAFVVNQFSNDVSQFRIGADGQLAPNAPALAPGRTAPYAIAVGAGAAPTSVEPAHFYALASGLVHQFDVGPNGQLAALSPPSAASSSDYVTSLALDPAGRDAYVVGRFFNGQWNVDRYDVLADGTMQRASGGFFEDSRARVVFDPAGRFVYVFDSLDPKADQYAVQRGSDPTFVREIAVAGRPGNAAFHPSGKMLYVGIAGDAIVQYRVLPDGDLADPVQTGLFTDLYGFAVHPSGRHFYVVDDDDGVRITPYLLDEDGYLDGAGAGVPLSDFFALAIDPEGDQLYVAGGASVERLTIGAGGELAAAEGPLALGGSVATIAVDPSGRFVYAQVRNPGFVDVAQLRRTASGALAPLAPASIRLNDSGDAVSDMVAVGTVR